MSIRTNPEKAVDRLLKRLAKATETLAINERDPVADRIRRIEDDLNGLKQLFPSVKEREQNLLEHFTTLDHCFRGFNGGYEELDLVDKEIIKMKSSVSQMHQLPQSVEETAPYERTVHFKSGHSDVPELEKEILKDPVMKRLQVSYDNLDRDKPKLRLCLLFLSVFPKNEVIKKWPLIYWWIGEGLIKTEEEGEEILEELLKLDLIELHGTGKFPVRSQFQLHPWIRYMLISLAKEALLFDFDAEGIPLFNITRSRRACLVRDAWKWSPENTSNFENLRTIFNVNENYLHFEPQWIASLKRLVVLQMGRWQNSPSHHIEIQDEKFIEALRTQKHLKYLSFRGISRITVLPDFILELVCLEILDLKSCHNLETLPDDISSLKKLTHLDISECYLLESMPKGLEKLTSLRVLKGFIVGNSKTPCRVGHLKSLKNLKRLSIHIGSESVIQKDEFDKLKDLKSVQRLKISWGVVSEKRKQVLEQPFSFPLGLQKLVLEGIPQDKEPEWLKPSKLTQLKKLYIKGGKLQNLMDHWKDRRSAIEIFLPSGNYNLISQENASFARLGAENKKEETKKFSISTSEITEES